MKYLESTIKFSIKNWMLILPLFVLLALANLLGGVGKAAVDFASLWSALGSLGDISNPGDVLSTLPGLFSAMALGSGAWAALFNFVAIPATYGLVSQSLETGNAGIHDIGAAIGKNFVKYVMYFIGTLAVWLAIGIAVLLLLLLLSLLVMLLKGFGIALLVIAVIALLVALAVFAVLISLWLSAMIVDNLDVIAGFKKSIEVVKGCFWTVLGITVLVSIAAGIAGAILGLLSGIPLLGPIIYSAAPAAQTFIMTVFLLTLYRERTGKVNAV